MVVPFDFAQGLRLCGESFDKLRIKSGHRPATRMADLRQSSRSESTRSIKAERESTLPFLFGGVCYNTKSVG
jgi:hypothetical protein